MEELFSKVFQDRGLSPACLRGLASIDRKQDEAGLLELAGRLKVECRFFSADQLREVKAPNPSPQVARHMGVDSVCEAAAMLAATSPELLVTKQKTPNATLAVALAGSG
jgi:cobalt-precorrin 5A hydrolase